MDLKQLNTFLTVAEFLNFTKAAAQLGYAQSSITAQIQQLENEMGVKLFERIGKTVTLTHEGKRMLPYASQILQLAGNMKSDLSGSDVPAGVLTIGAAESLSIYRLPAIIKEYRSLYPKVDINLKLLHCSEFIPNLMNGTIDAAFTIGNEIEAEFLIEVFQLPEPMALLAHPEHLLARKKHVASEDLETEALLLTGKDCCYRGMFTDKLAENHILPRVALETDSIQAIKLAAMSGLGICILPKISIQEEVSSGKLATLNFPTEDFEIVSQLLYHKDKWISAAFRAFLELSAEIMHNMPALF